MYLAEDTKLGRKVAVKTMRSELAANKLDRDRFVREARAAVIVRGDYIVPIRRWERRRTVRPSSRWSSWKAKRSTRARSAPSAPNFSGRSLT